MGSFGSRAYSFGHVSNSEGYFGIRGPSPIAWRGPFPSTINLTWGALGQERIHSGMCQTPRAVSVSEVRARLHDAARFRARSTSHGELWVKSVFIRACVKLRGLFRYPRSEPDCMTRPGPEHEQ